MTMNQTKQILKKLDNLVGTPIDADNFGGNQCVDVIKWYINEIHGRPYSFGGAAYKLWNNDDWFTRQCVKIDPKNSPYPETVRPKYQQGDILVYAPNTKNQFGHVAICANNSNLYSGLHVYEQNGFDKDTVLMKEQPMLREDELLGIVSYTIPADKWIPGLEQKEEEEQLPPIQTPKPLSLKKPMKTKAEHPKKVLSSVGKSSTKYVLPTSVILGALYKIYPDIATDPHTISLVTAGVGIVWANFIKVLEGLLKVDLNQDNKIG